MLKNWENAIIDRNKEREIQNDIYTMVKKIKVYIFLEEYTKILIKVNEEKLINNSDFEWIDIQKTSDNMRSIRQDIINKM